MGYGAINQQVHKMLTGFQCDFVICKNRKWDKKPNEIQCFSIEENELNNFLKIVDILIVAVPSTQANKHLLNEKNMSLLQKHCLLLNVGRGDVIEEKALFNVLKQEKITGAAIDVWYNYRPEADESDKKYPYNFPFHELENIVLSPHRAASPMNDLQRWNDVIFNINEALKPSPNFTNIIDFEMGY